MKRDFDFYEFAGIIAPGMLVIVGFAFILFPDLSTLKKIADLSIGGLGIGVLVAYVAGQLLQSLGNGIENVYWRIRSGMPTDWVRTGKHNLIAISQRNILQDKVRQMIKDDTFVLNSSLQKEQWYSITRQI